MSLDNNGALSGWTDLGVYFIIQGPGREAVCGQIIGD